jgi:hypothetical protein
MGLAPFSSRSLHSVCPVANKNHPLLSDHHFVVVQRIDAVRVWCTLVFTYPIYLYLCGYDDFVRSILLD